MTEYLVFKPYKSHELTSQQEVISRSEFQTIPRQLKKLHKPLGIVDYQQHPFAEGIRSSLANTLAFIKEKYDLLPTHFVLPRIYIIPQEDFKVFAKKVIPVYENIEGHVGFVLHPNIIYVADTDDLNSLLHYTNHELVHLLVTRRYKMVGTEPETFLETDLYGFSNRRGSFLALHEVLVEMLNIESLVYRGNSLNKIGYEDLIVFFDHVFADIAKREEVSSDYIRDYFIKAHLLGDFRALKILKRNYGVEGVRALSQLPTTPTYLQLLEVANLMGLDETELIEKLKKANDQGIAVMNKFILTLVANETNLLALK